MKTTTKKPEMWVRINNCIECPNVSKEAYQDLLPLLELLNKLSLTASKQTHYHNLNEWGNVVDDYIHDMLKKYGFINAAPLLGLDQPADAEFWWEVSGLFGGVIYSPNLKSVTAHHHASAWERNEAFIKDVMLLKNAVLHD